jgi:hypothetical protein
MRDALFRRIAEQETAQVANALERRPISKRLTELWVITSKINDARYGFDSDMPDEVFFEKADAEAERDRLNGESKPFLGQRMVYVVETLFDRIERVRLEAKSEGESEGYRQGVG